MAIYQRSKDVILAAINAQNSLNIRAVDIVYSAPKDIRDTDKGNTTNRNTQIKVSAATTGSNWSGRKNVYYNRYLLSDIPVLLGNTLEIGGSVTDVHSALIGLNNRYGFQFTEDDLVNEPIEWAEDGLTGTVLLTAKTTSMDWVGQQSFNVERGDESLQSAVGTNVLSGLKYPDGTMGSVALNYTIAEVFGYPFDFTKWTQALKTIQPQVLTGAPLSDMVNILKDVTTVNWVSSASTSWGLAGAEILANGLNKPEYPANQKYKYVMVLKLPTTTTNIRGTLYIQYNDPESPDEV